MSPKKIIGKVHLWLGFTSGLVVFILGITGAILAFEDEIKAIVYAHKLQVTPEKSQSLLSESFLKAQRALGDTIPIERIRISNEPSHAYIFTHYTANKKASGIWYGSDVKHSYWVYTNPYSSEVIEVEDHTFEFFRVVAVLHWRLLLINDIGQPIVGIATLIFFVMLVSGIILWWPKNKAARKQRLWFRWKSTTNWKRKNYDIHNVIGFYSTFLVLFVVFTGLVWAFDWFEDSVKWIANGGKNIKANKLEVYSTPSREAVGHPVDIVYHQIKTRYPRAMSYSINMPDDSLAPVKASIYFHERYKNLSLQFDQYDGKQLAIARWEDKSNGDKIRDYNKDIHTGVIGGVVGKTIAFFLSVFAASLPVTGFFIWWGRRKKKAVPTPTRLSKTKPTRKPKPLLTKQ